MNNTVQLITYVDRLSGGDIGALHQLLDNQLAGLFDGVHLLPYFYPIDGSDAGFDPIDHTVIDSRLGNWNDLQRLGTDYNIMSDLIVNHMSAQSPQFQDVLKHGRQSAYWDLFLTREKVFPNGMTCEQQAAIVQPKADGCFTPYQLASGETIDFWTTFTSNQIDIDVTSNAGRQYIDNVIEKFATNNIKLVRLDAAGFAIKQAGTSCFMLEPTFDFINQLSNKINALGMESLVEVHSYYKNQIDIAKKVNLVYDFALPPLVLHAIYQRDAQPLINWLKVAPRNCITVLDTHDGIGIEDVSGSGSNRGLLTDEQVSELVTQIATRSDGESLKASGSAAGNVDEYQVNCSYYSALGCDDYDYLIARAIQFFSPGVPQLYYGGLLALSNDMELLADSNVGRDINRSYLSPADVEKHLEKSIVKALIKLIDIRNSHPAFNGRFSMNGTAQTLTLGWSLENQSIELDVDLATNTAVIAKTNPEGSEQIALVDLL